ncbi:MAG: putative bifunctional diguanylate cyclase/phosphodiesterase [Acidimicrobiia bacterium]
MELQADDLPRRVRAGERLVAGCSQRLLITAAADIEAAVIDTLGSVGQWLNADAGLFVHSTMDDRGFRSFRWVAEGGEARVARDEVAQHIMGWGEIIASVGEPLFFSGLDTATDSDLADGVDLIRRLGLHSLVLYPVTPNGALDGIAAYSWVGRDAPHQSVALSVALVADVVQNALVRASIERESMAQARLVEALLHSAAEGLLVVDRDGHITWAGSNVDRFTGMSADTLTPDALLQMVDPDDIDGLVDLFNRAVAHPNEPISTTFRTQRTDGGSRWVEMVMTNRLDDETIGGIILNARDVSERVEAARALEWAANHDRLTGLWNTNALLERISWVAVTDDYAPALLTIALDRFRVINDSLGHEAGNRVLQTVAERLVEAVRTEDAVARVGGDEFAVLFTEAPRSVPALDALIDRVIDSVHRPVDLDGVAVQISTSVGVARIERNADDPSTLLHESDSAMARAKRAGRGRVVHFHADLHRESARRMAVEQAIHRALANDEFVLHYQPIVDLASGHTVGAEALVRWIDPTRGMVPPSEFIPVAEETGLIIDIGRWVLESATRNAGDWYRTFGTTVSINVAVHQLVDSQFPQLVESTIARHRVPPEALCFELTETGDTDAWTAVAETIHGLRALGSRIAMDDLGTGYATLERLRHLPVDVVKLDASHVGRIEGSPVDAAIVRALTELAKALGVVLVAEGVETAETHAQLQALGATLGQGYLYGRPAPATDYQSHLRTVADTA